MRRFRLSGLCFGDRRLLQGRLTDDGRLWLSGIRLLEGGLRRLLDGGLSV